MKPADILMLLFLVVITCRVAAQTDYDTSPTINTILVKDSAGIGKIEQEFRLKFIRKPDKDLLVLKIQKLADRNMDFRLTNPAGEELGVDISRSRNTCYIDLAMLPGGTYILNIYDFDLGNVARIKVKKSIP
jgi:hypothetical protein